MATYIIQLDRRKKLKNGLYNLVVRVNMGNDMIYLNFSKMTEKQYDHVFVKRAGDEDSIAFREKCEAFKTKCERTFNKVKPFNKARFRVLLKEKEKEEYDNNAERILENEGVNGFLEFIIGLELKNDEPSTRYLAIFYALAGNREKALDYLEFNVTSYISEYQYLNVEPSFTVLHNEPRFLALLKKVGYKT